MLAWMFRCFPHLRLVYGLPQLFDILLLGITLVFHRERSSALHQIEKTALSWPGVMTKVHRFGGTEFTLQTPRGGREIGHLHSNGLLDIPFSKSIRDEVIQAGLAQPHHIFPQSAWISFFVHSEQDNPIALSLLRRNYERRLSLDCQEADTD